MKPVQPHLRLIAKGIDFFLVIYVSWEFQAFWVIVSLIYLLICDGFFKGQSLGKRVVGLKTLYLDKYSGDYQQCTFVQSTIRNCEFAAILLLSCIPTLGIVFVILGVILVGMEVYFMYTDSEKLRIGDIYAKTKVVQAITT